MTTALTTRTITVRYFAGAKAAAGTRSEPVTVPAGATVVALVVALAADHGEALTRVLGSASFLLDEVAYFGGTALRDEYLIVDGGRLAGAGAHSYSANP